MKTEAVKQAAHELVDRLLGEASWDDLVYEMVVRRK